MSPTVTSLEYTVDVRLTVIQDLLAKSKDGLLKTGTIKETAVKFSINRKTVSNNWIRYKDVENDGNILDPIRSRKCGHKERRKRGGEDVKKVIRTLLFDVGVIFVSLREYNAYNGVESTLKHPRNVDREVYHTFIVEKVLPVIRRKWPVRGTGKIFAQQGNAPAHISADDYKVVGNGQLCGWDISMHAQPPNSPDFNVLDLGSFRTLQSASQEHEMNDIGDVVKYVTESFHKMNPWALNEVFFFVIQAHGGVNGG